MAMEVHLLIHRQSMCVRRSVLVVAVASATLALGACDAGSGDSRTNTQAGGAPSVVAPGKPGEPARTLTAEEAVKAAGSNTPNSADFRYVQMMIQHHAQALELTGLVAARSGSAAVKRLAERITAGQKPEIGAMEGWLTHNDGVKRGTGHDHSAMPGMATPAQLEQLRTADGAAFDKLFLKLMITHHQGAITMATDVLSQGNDVLVEEMAGDVVAQQTVEIDRMRAMSS
ncbi:MULTISPECIES: DUF305 domain-containing protein [unclassified Streptomyces]|uniref:DUF305 domain-containing protein n=1 Tax=unclassified Streptomyces TaxID=2593676 RepID=UPI002259CB69|nr:MULTISPECIES: DUF305 domain-containing protein [unclassified Streptomyces]MCX4798969.1 DUF305 domain-containing protein [Streptomyces sp. NBC_01242]WSJ40167.1 DUF305 domain-containing protein [Streptomyces sp. NBC_01321]WSP66471.1 DUF305 domain-containing protein [Streptomyces sp. NBC_01240]WSU25642.1 DUF305 domain-containing protein [Streptomyces sp. NBC_01108]